MDQIVRVIAKDAPVKAMAISARDMVERARAIHDCWPVASAALGRLLTSLLILLSIRLLDSLRSSLSLFGRPRHCRRLRRGGGATRQAQGEETRERHHAHGTNSHINHHSLAFESLSLTGCVSFVEHASK